MKDKRATGWKIPMIFCCLILSVVVVIGWLRHEPVDVPNVPAPLLEAARALVINLDADKEGRTWKENISSTAGAFATRADKDKRIEALVERALAAQRLDAACTATVLMYNDHQRDAMLEKIARQSMEDCQTVPWAVMAAKGLSKPARQAALHDSITGRWLQCRGK